MGAGRRPKTPIDKGSKGPAGAAPGRSAAGRGGGARARDSARALGASPAPRPGPRARPTRFPAGLQSRCSPQKSKAANARGGGSLKGALGLAEGWGRAPLHATQRGARVRAPPPRRCLRALWHRHYQQLRSVVIVSPRRRQTHPSGCAPPVGQRACAFGETGREGGGALAWSARPGNKHMKKQPFAVFNSRAAAARIKSGARQDPSPALGGCHAHNQPAKNPYTL